MNLSIDPKPKLLVDWASTEATKYACMHWHYSRCVPKSKQVRLGVWENGSFIGVVLVGNSSGSNVFKFLGLNQWTGAELTRIALTKHITPVSKILSISLRIIKKYFPKVMALVSYADQNVGHSGIVYQASNWKYFGLSSPCKQFFFRGKWRNDMKLNELFKGRRSEMKGLPTRKLLPKHKYVFFFDKRLEENFKTKFQKYPCGTSKDTVASQFRCEGRGENPTVPLHLISSSMKLESKKE